MTQVEAFLQGITGLKLTGDRASDELLPLITATVSFGGSAQQMKVGSSTICGTTGRLVVESNPVKVDTSTNKEDGTTWLLADWKEKMTYQKLPHVTLTLPVKDPSLPKDTLEKTNRDSLVLKEDDDGASQLTSTSSSSPVAVERGQSAVWSNSGEALPEIIELFVRLKIEGQLLPQQIGLAYLVLFGHEQDQGTFTIELPVKEPLTKSSTSTSTLTDALPVQFTERTRLSVKLRVRRNMKLKTNSIQPSLSTVSTESTEFTDESIRMSRSILEREVGPLLQKIKRGEREALDFRRAQKRAIDIEIHPAEHQSPYFCSSSWNWSRFLHALSQAVRQCDTGSTAAAFDDGASIDSSILTRESLDI